jgi:hypothetical protein
MGDKSPMAKRRDDKQKSAAEVKEKAEAKAKQDNQSRFSRPPVKGNKQAP